MNNILRVGIDPSRITDDDKNNIMDHITKEFIKAYSIFIESAREIKEITENIYTDTDSKRYTDTDTDSKRYTDTDTDSKRYAGVNEYIKNMKITDMAGYNKITDIIESSFDECTPYVLVRFSRLKQSLLSHVKYILSDLWQKNIRRLRRSLHTILDRYITDNININLSNFKIKANKLAQLLIFDIFYNNQSLGFDKFHDIFIEDDKYMVQRNNEQIRIHHVEKSISMLDNLYL
jgi:hypothetical protein